MKQIDVKSITIENHKTFLHVSLEPHTIHVDQLIANKHTNVIYKIQGIERRTHWVDNIIGPHLALRVIEHYDE